MPSSPGPGPEPARPASSPGLPSAPPPSSTGRAVTSVQPRSGAASAHPRGLSPEAQDVSTALVALSRAARSFGLYDAQNEAVKRLVGDYREKMVLLVAHAPLALDVAAFEIGFGGEVVYRETDRERSLAFRFFRDGVRKIRVEPGFSWEEQLKLLEVLAVRCSGVRQTEDDLITLLRRAGFSRLAFDVVEGFVPSEENPELEAALAPSRQAYLYDDPPEDWDLPLPPADSRAPIGFVPIPATKLEGLRREESPAALADAAVRAASELVELARDLCDDAMLDEALGFADEVRELLLVDRRLDRLADLVAALGAAGIDPARVPVLAWLASEGALDRLLAAVPDDATDAPPALLSLLAWIPGDPLAHALEGLSRGAQGAKRRALLGVARREAGGRLDELFERLKAAPPGIAADLFALLRELAPERAADVAHDLAAVEDEPLLLAVVDAVAAQRGIRMARTLQTLLDAPFEAVRVRAAERLADRGGLRAVPLLAERAERAAATGASIDEIAAIGRAIALADRREALQIFAEWTGPHRGLRAIVSRLKDEAAWASPLVWAALAGLELIPGEEAESLVEAAASRAPTEELAARCAELLASKRGQPIPAPRTALPSAPPPSSRRGGTGSR